MMVDIDFSARPARGVVRDIAILDLLVWAFRTECARLEFDQVAEFGQSVVGGSYLCMQRGLLGCAVDGGGRSARHHDADIVADAVANLPVECGGRGMAVSIAALARAGAVPDWMEGAVPRIVPVGWTTNRHGRRAKTEAAGMVTVMRRGRAVSIESRVCPVVVTPSPAAIGAARRRYLDWWGALLDLRATLAPRMTHWRLVSDMPPMTPWENQD